MFRAMKAFVDAREGVRFLIAGGSAALLAWLLRIVLSLYLPFGIAVGIASIISLVYGFWLYRGFVYRSRSGSIGRQAYRYFAVNIVGAAVTVAVSVLASAGLQLAGMNLIVAEGVAHAVGIAVAALVNYLLHRVWTFKT